MGLFSKYSECPAGTRCCPRSEDKHTDTTAQFPTLMDLEVQLRRHLHIELTMNYVVMCVNEPYIKCWECTGDVNAERGCI